MKIIKNYGIIKNYKLKTIAILLGLALIINGLSIFATAYGDTTQTGDRLNGWHVGTFWDKATDANSLSWYLTNNQTNNAKLTVDYYVPLENMTRDYAPGTVRFAIPDIGEVKREGSPFKPLTTASQAGSDWNCKYQKLDNNEYYYVFTNNTTFPANEPLSGGFTMLWQIKGRECKKEYDMVKQPIFSLRDENSERWDNLLMPEIRFHCETARDYYTVDLQSSILGFDSFNNPTLKKDHFITYQYETDFHLNKRARAGDLNTYFVKVDVKDKGENDSMTELQPLTDQSGNPMTVEAYEELMQSVQLVYYYTEKVDDKVVTKTSTGGLTKIEDPYSPGKEVWGFYRFIDKESEELGKDRFYLAFPESIEGKVADVSSFLEVHYLEEDENKYYRYDSDDLVTAGQTVLEVLNDNDRKIVSSYSYIFGKGNFSATKTNPYEVYYYGNSQTYEGKRPQNINSQYLSKQLYNHGKATFRIGGQYRMTTSTSSGSGTKKTTSTSADSDEPAPGDTDSGLGLDLNTEFDMILADDRVSALQNNGSFRLLKSHEYKITRFEGPVDSRKYDYDIFISNVGYNGTGTGIARLGNHLERNSADSDYVYYGSGNTGTAKNISFNNLTSCAGMDFPDGVKALYIKVKGFSGNYSIYYYVDMEFNCDYIPEAENEPDPYNINPSEKVSNLVYMKAFKTGQDRNVFTVTDANYGNSSFNTGTIIPLDQAYLGGYVYHAMSTIFLRDMQTQLTSATDLKSTKRTRAEGDGYNVSITSSGTIVADKTVEDIPTEVKKFALYTKVPALVTLDSKLSDVTLKNCRATDILGESVFNSAFEQNVSFRLLTVGDEKVVATEFDFSDSPIDLTKSIYLEVHIPAEILYTDFRVSPTKSITVTSYTKLNENGSGKITALNGSIMDTYDFNGNGNTREVMASSSKENSYASLVEEWKDTVEKFVKSYRDETWKYHSTAAQDDNNKVQWISETTVNASSEDLDETANLRSTYQYRVSFDMGLPTSKIVFADQLEKAVDRDGNASKWQGTLKSIDFTYARTLGLVPRVYYTTNPTLIYTETWAENSHNAEYTSNLSAFQSNAVTGNVWTAPNDSICYIAVTLDTDYMSGGYIKDKQIYFLINMKAPDDTSISRDDSVTDMPHYGDHAINDHMVYYTSQTSVNYTRMKLVGSVAKVKIVPPVSLLTMVKHDADTQKPLEGAKYSFYTDPEATTLAKDWLGNPAEDITSDRFGEVVVDILEPGTYWYKETGAPLGYLLDLNEQGKQMIYQIKLKGPDKTYKLEGGGYDPTYVKNDEKLKGNIILTKKDSDDETVKGIKGAVFMLHEAEGATIYTDENNKYLESGGTRSEFTTDENGKLTITGLPWGNYYLEEIEAPVGYELNSTKVWVNISKNASTSESQEENRAIVVDVEQTDKEKTASARLIKYDRDGATPLANAWFQLEKKTKDGDWKAVSEYEYIKTGSNGSVTAPGLKFGTYRFKEINPPVGYDQPDNEYSDEIVLNTHTVDDTVTVTKKNERIQGKAILRKISDDGLPLNGAIFDLYLQKGVCDEDENRPADDPADALLYSNLQTKNVDGQPGIISVSGLDWGSYYFKEIASPSGYDKAGLMKFAITAENAAVGYDSSKDKVTNYRRKGEVILNKIAAKRVTVGNTTFNEGDSVPGAEFALFTADGERVYVMYDPESHKYSVCDKDNESSLTTMRGDAEGKITVDNISWGAYYFEETKAPEGFALGEKVRFTVNSTTCTSVQELECEDEPMKCMITIEKEIDRKLEVFGTPTFIFKIKQLEPDTNEVVTDYTTMITLKDNMTSGYTTVQVPIGKYKVEEVPVNRYKLAETQYVLGEDKTTVPEAARFIDSDRVDKKPSEGYEETGKAFVFTLSSENEIPQKVRVRFTNNLDDFSGISHTDALTNIIPSRRKITGFSIRYADDFIPCDKTNESMSFDLERSKLIGKITYDDGSEVDMTQDQINQVLNVTPEAPDQNKFTLDIGYPNAGQIIPFTAQYTNSESGKSYKSNFYITIGQLNIVETQRVIFRTDEDNSCVFPVGKKRYSVNTVYYNDEANHEGVKTAVSGEYIKPAMIGEQRYFLNWKVLNGEDAGKLLAPNEDAVKEYLALMYADNDKYPNGLRELELQAVVGNPVYEFDYKGEVEVFTAPRDGIYYLEGWGGQGGDAKGTDGKEFQGGINASVEQYYGVEGGRGGYSYGYVYLKKDQKVYIAVGGKGKTNIKYNNTFYTEENSGGYNGGGDSNISANVNYPIYEGGGGGATHFATSLEGTGELSQYENKKNNVLLVAGGGGGSGFYNAVSQPSWYHYGHGGYGGGETGGTNFNNNMNENQVHVATGGTQSSGGTSYYGNKIWTQSAGSFGQGSSFAVFPDGRDTATNGASGGGGGWYGGAASYRQGGGGGSGHVNESALITGATIGGNQSFISPEGSLEKGHVGEGHARVTYIEDGQFNLQFSQTVNQFTAPYTGYYKLEGWGGAGGAAYKTDSYPSTVNNGVISELKMNEGGRGGYSSGYVYLTKGQNIYYAVGGQGNDYSFNMYVNPNTLSGTITGGYNGGSDSQPTNNSIWSAGSGGGATHFVMTKQSDGLLNKYSSYISDVLLVAGGGGGSGYYYYQSTNYAAGSGGAGGGLQAQDAYDQFTIPNCTYDQYKKGGGGSQTSGGTTVSNEGNGSFGQGGKNSNYGAGGGGGFYGGGSGRILGAGGGSSYIANSNLIRGQTIAGNTVDYTTANGTVMKPENMPTHPGAIVDNGIVGVNSNDVTMIGNRGDGFARITYIPYTEPIDYTYTNKMQSFTAPVTGIYMLEGWGASGGDAKQTQDASIGILKGGRGGYSYGNVYLTAGQTIYLAVGGEGESIAFRVNGVPQTTYSTLRRGGGYNGGGDAYLYSIDTYKYAGGGGGATHFALTKRGTGVLSDYEAVKDTDVLLVAGGGGGALYCSSSSWLYAAYGGYGGGEIGGSGKVTDSKDKNFKNKEIPGGTQEQQTNYGNYTFGTFGQGTNATSNSIADGGGGGGWYGGAKGIDVNKSMSGGGGSGHVNTDALISGETIGGNNPFAAPDGTSENGHTGDGYARVTFISSPDVEDFEYTGSVQTFKATRAGTYQFEAWGASGGNGIGDGRMYENRGRGGYTSGKIYLDKNEEIYIYVGGCGKDAIVGSAVSGGYNGGGGSDYDHSDDEAGAGGGGATDFRLVKSTANDGWSGFDSLKSRIMVAGGGGGGDYYSALGGGGGGTEGLKGYVGIVRQTTTPTLPSNSQPGTQTAGYKFGSGQTYVCDINRYRNYIVGGGGSGYYGATTVPSGSSGCVDCGGDGGSSFISGYPTCNAIAEDSTENNIIHTNQPNHYSGKVFTNAVTIDGSSVMPTYDGKGTMTGNTGNGYAKISFLG